jgi:hypothetical protein
MYENTTQSKSTTIVIVCTVAKKDATPDERSAETLRTKFIGIKPHTNPSAVPAAVLSETIIFFVTPTSTTNSTVAVIIKYVPNFTFAAPNKIIAVYVKKTRMSGNLSHL